jgi:hypothetical protein
MARYFITFVFFLFSSVIFCQRRLEFKDYEQILPDINLKGQKSEYFNNLNFEFMLYLDKRCLKDLLRLDPEFTKKYSIDTSQFSLPGINPTIKYFKTDTKDIRWYFLDHTGKKLLRIYLHDQHNDEFSPDYPIYTKDSEKAVFSNGNKTYRISLIGGGMLKTEILDEIIE